MRHPHLSDTGKQIEAKMRRTYPNASSMEQQAVLEEAAECENAMVEQPLHPVAALGATFLVIAALIVALTLTSLVFLASIIAVPVTIGACAVLGFWAFLAVEKHRKRVRERLVDPGLNE